MPQAAIEFKDVNKWFGKLHVLPDITCWPCARVSRSLLLRADAVIQ